MRSPLRHVALSAALALTVVTLTLPDGGHADPRPSAGPLLATPALADDALADDGHDHVHDPATKNAISRAVLSSETADPTSAEEARANAAYVAAERAMPEPTLTTVPLREPRLTAPDDRYEMAGGCYTMAGRKVFFQATDLGRYLLVGPNAAVLEARSDGVAAWAAKPSVRSDWTVTYASGLFTFRLDDGRHLRESGASVVTGATPTGFTLRLTTGCTAYPEIQTDVAGDPHAGITSFQEVRGYVDPHVHGMVYEFLGGDVHCGKPFHRYGAPAALVDCPDHTLTGGKGALLEALLSGEASHDPVGWPTFKDWPAPESLTHEGMYHRWVERSWRGGQRLMVNLLTENNKLCQLYPIKHNSCDDMDSIRLQAQRAREMERYVDAQYGGPGKGWYRIVTSPWQAREVINAGKLAVILGIETSIPFGCTQHLGIPACSTAEIDAQLDEVWKLGVRQMELVNKFDNALSGVAGDSGEVGVVVNTANFLETLSFWRMQHCEPADGESHDQNQVTLPIGAEQQDALFGAVALLSLPLQALPLYASAPHCNAMGLSRLGSHLINRMAEKHMIFDPDHMSVKSRQAALTQLEAKGYPGVVSSHSWSTPDAYPRIYKLGGFVAPYAGDSTGFLAKWQRHLGWADERFYFGFGFGADMNGLGAQGAARGAGVANPVTYPFTGLGGVRVDQQHSGQRVYDINADGVSHYGLYPDWVEDLRQVGGAADGEAITSDLARGAEAYLQMWERAEGIKADSCRNADLRLPEATVHTLVRPGMTTLQVMRAVGQPWTRLGSTYGICATTPANPRVRLDVIFDNGGRVVDVRRSS